jgi:RNA polymerase sigma factor (sigma-70 family)
VKAPHLRLLPSPSTPLSERSDDQLTTLAQAGLRDAFAVLVERHAGRVVAVCARYVGDSQLALELAQETWLSVWTERERFDAQGRFVVWLITTARNRCRNQLRHHSIVRRHQQQTFEPTPAAGQIERLLQAERRRQLQDALAHLPEPLRDALALRYEHELRYEQMAEVLHVGEITLRSRVHQALKLLRKWLETKP